MCLPRHEDDGQGKVGYEQCVGEQFPLVLTFRGDTCRTVALGALLGRASVILTFTVFGDILDGHRPVILLPLLRFFLDRTLMLV